MRKVPRVVPWLPVVTWMGMIFAGSTDVLSVPHTSRFIGPILRWLFPGISENAIGWVQLFVRKTGHGVEYAILATLIWCALNWTWLGIRRVWPRRWALWSWGLATVYALTDEFHQSFVPSRQGQVRDVLIDSLGAALAVVILWRLGHWRGRWLPDSPVVSAANDPVSGR